MVHCSECETSLASMDDVEFVDVESRTGFVRASKRFYVVECASCGYSIGSGVAGARANSGGTAGVQ
jgi:predicted nucleic-acid-binding Zn-ribbon protein